MMQTLIETTSTGLFMGDNIRPFHDMRTGSLCSIALMALLFQLDSSAASAPLLATVELRDEFLRKQSAMRPDTHIIDSQKLIKQFEVSENLTRYADLPIDWDGDGGHAPDRKDIENAIRFIPHIPDHALLSAELMVAGDGDVGFRWRTANSFLEIGFSDGDISFYGEILSGETGKGEEVFANTVPENLRTLMQSVFSG